MNFDKSIIKIDAETNNFEKTKNTKDVEIEKIQLIKENGEIVEV
jgi:hypothetical protein